MDGHTSQTCAQTPLLGLVVTSGRHPSGQGGVGHTRVRVCVGGAATPLNSRDAATARTTLTDSGHGSSNGQKFQQHWTGRGSELHAN
jgi:hypothetical protein